jgi:AcrR family transcriptional regulator
MTAHATKTVEISRRLAHKKRSTHVLREAAFELFLAQGYEATTTDQIAAKAGVSVRTFFRYFETKDELLFKGQLSWAEKVADTLMEQSKSLNPVEAMCNTLVRLASKLNRDALVRYEKIIESSVTLRGRSDFQNMQNSRFLAEALGSWKGLDTPDAECELLGAICLLLFRRAVDDVRDGLRDASIEDLIREQFATLRHIFKK